MAVSPTFGKLFIVSQKDATYSAHKPVAEFAGNVDTDKLWLCGELKF